MRRRRGGRADAGDPAGEVLRLQREPPDEGAPVHVHTAWHDRQAELWDQIAAQDVVMAGNAQWMADFHRRRAKELCERLPQVTRTVG